LEFLINKKIISNNRNVILVFIITFTLFTIINVNHMSNYEHSTKENTLKLATSIVSGDESYYLAMTSLIINHNSLFMEEQCL